MNPQSERPVTSLDRFELENDRILRESQQADKEAKGRIGEYEKKLTQAKGKLEKAQAQFERLRSDFERIEAETLESERRRIAAAAVKKEDVVSGSVTAEEYFKKGQDEETISAAARSETEKKLAQLLGAVRTKSLEVLQLEVEEAECEREIVFLKTYSSVSLLERMRAQVKSLESFLMATAGTMPIWTKADEKKTALKRATQGTTTSMIWRDLDLVAVKQLRFDAGIPESELPNLLRIISEMEVRPDSKVDLRFDATAKTGKALAIFVWR